MRKRRCNKNEKTKRKSDDAYLHVTVEYSCVPLGSKRRGPE